MNKFLLELITSGAYIKNSLPLKVFAVGHFSVCSTATNLGLVVEIVMQDAYIRVLVYVAVT